MSPSHLRTPEDVHAIRASRCNVTLLSSVRSFVHVGPRNITMDAPHYDSASQGYILGAHMNERMLLNNVVEGKACMLGCG